MHSKATKDMWKFRAQSHKGHNMDLARCVAGSDYALTNAELHASCHDGHPHMLRRLHQGLHVYTLTHLLESALGTGRCGVSIGLWPGSLELSKGIGSSNARQQVLLRAAGLGRSCALVYRLSFKEV